VFNQSTKGLRMRKNEGLVEVVDSEEAMTVEGVASISVEGVNGGVAMDVVGCVRAQLGGWVDSGGLSEPVHGLSLGPCQ
jgi:hypothetical protein